MFTNTSATISLTTLNALFVRHALRIVDVERIPITAARSASLCGAAGAAEAASPHVAALLAEESAWGVADAAFYQAFSAKVEQLKANLRALLADQGRGQAHRRLWCVRQRQHAAAIISVLGTKRYDCVVDRSTVKQGLYTPGTHLLIEPPERLLTDIPDYVLLLTWNFADEILPSRPCIAVAVAASSFRFLS